MQYSSLSFYILVYPLPEHNSHLFPYNITHIPALDELKDSKRTVCYRSILISENEKKRLLDDVMENPYDLFYNGKYLVKEYPEQVYELSFYILVYPLPEHNSHLFPYKMEGE